MYTTWTEVVDISVWLNFWRESAVYLRVSPLAVLRVGSTIVELAMLSVSLLKVKI